MATPRQFKSELWTLGGMLSVMSIMIDYKVSCKSSCKVKRFISEISTYQRDSKVKRCQFIDPTFLI